VILVGDTYYGYSTNAANQNIPIISSTDLAHWQRERDALPALPRWAKLVFGLTWAPGVIQIDDDSFLLYFVSRDKESDLQCIGMATSDSPIGPFKDDSDEAFVCQTDLGGSIDPYPYRDADGQLYLYWKNDGNCCGKPVELWVQQLSDDGQTLRGKPQALIARDQPWEVPLVENPAVVEDAGEYYLFYSANRWDTFEYAVGYAACDSATGPCTKPLREPVFKYTLDIFGPGGESFFTTADGSLFMAYHGWLAPNVGYPQGQRSLFIDPVTFQDGAPVMTGPTIDPQPLT
jgi:beta-xylosidase